MEDKYPVIKQFVIPREVYTCALIEFLTTFGTSIAAVPATRLIEGAICQRYYATESNLAEHLCKIDIVQSDLAYLLGGYSSLTSLPGLFLAIPYGILSEHIDRRFILLVNSFSSVLENIFLVAVCKCYHIKLKFFVIVTDTTTGGTPRSDLRLIWLCGVFEIIGGGAAIHSMIIRTIIGEAVPAAYLSVYLQSIY